MNAWSNTLKSVPFDDPNGTDPKNDAEFFQNRAILGWTAESLVQGGEIIRHTNAGWSSTDIARFESMLTTHYVPQLEIGWTSGANLDANWANGLVNIGVFTDDRALYNKGIENWKNVARSYIYENADGAQPPYFFSPRYNREVSNTPTAQKSRFYNPTQYINGHSMETCRDLGHTFMGLGALANGAETALINGTDLYSHPQFKNKLIVGFELNAGYANQMLDQMAAIGQTAKQVSDSSWKPLNFPCADYKDGGGSAFLGVEIAYNHFANRLGISMPNTKKLTERVRPQKGGNHLLFQTATKPIQATQLWLQ